MKLQKPSKKAVLFDYDGVIVNSMDDMYMAWSNTLLNMFNIPLNRNEFFPLEGYPALKIAQKICRQKKIDKNKIKNILIEKEKFYFNNNNFKLNKKVPTILNFLKRRNILIGLVSGAPKSRISKMLAKKIFEIFDVIIGSEDCSKFKPNPYPYNLALKKLNISASEAVVVENAPLGIKSAKRAKIYCIGIQSTLPKEFLVEADLIIEDFDKLLISIKKLFKKNI